MTDERLEALAHHLELLSPETEKPDKQIAQRSPLVTEVAGARRDCCGCGDARTPA
jgi:hypothetical protein